MQTNESELIFLCTRLDINNVMQQKIKELLTTALKWDKIIDLVDCHQVMPFLYYNLNKLNFQDIVPQHIFTKMKAYYYINMHRNLIFEKEISLISELAEHNGVNIVPLKGLSLILTVYNNPGLRIMADVDMLIKKNELEKIRPILTQLGYKEIQKKDPDDFRHMAIFSKIPVSNLPLFIELHGILAYARPYEIKMPNLWERAYKKTIDNQKLLFLSQEDTFISLVLHLRSHTRRLTLKFIVDIAELLNINRDTLDWVYIKGLAKNNHILCCVYVSLYLAKELLQANISPLILDIFRPNIIKRYLIHSCINKHNFLTFKKWQGAWLRLLLFDCPIDLVLYIWRVSFLERFIAKITTINSGDKIKK